MSDSVDSLPAPLNSTLSKDMNIYTGESRFEFRFRAYHAGVPPAEVNAAPYAPFGCGLPEVVPDCRLS